MSIIRPKCRPPLIPANTPFRDMMTMLDSLACPPNFFSDIYPDSLCGDRLEQAARILFGEGSHHKDQSGLRKRKEIEDAPNDSTEYSHDNSELPLVDPFQSQPATIAATSKRSTPFNFSFHQTPNSRPRHPTSVGFGDELSKGTAQANEIAPGHAEGQSSRSERPALSRAFDFLGTTFETPRSSQRAPNQSHGTLSNPAANPLCPSISPAWSSATSAHICSMPGETDSLDDLDIDDLDSDMGIGPFKRPITLPERAAPAMSSQSRPAGLISGGLSLAPTSATARPRAAGPARVGANATGAASLTSGRYMHPCLCLCSRPCDLLGSFVFCVWPHQAKRRAVFISEQAAQIRTATHVHAPSGWG
jgi:hypothetical protein